MLERWRRRIEETHPETSSKGEGNKHALGRSELLHGLLEATKSGVLEVVRLDGLLLLLPSVVESGVLDGGEPRSAMDGLGGRDVSAFGDGSGELLAHQVDDGPALVGDVMEKGRLAVVLVVVVVVGVSVASRRAQRRREPLPDSRGRQDLLAAVAGLVRDLALGRSSEGAVRRDGQGDGGEEGGSGRERRCGEG